MSNGREKRKETSRKIEAAIGVSAFAIWIMIMLVFCYLVWSEIGLLPKQVSFFKRLRGNEQAVSLHFATLPGDSIPGVMPKGNFDVQMQCALPGIGADSGIVVQECTALIPESTFARYVAQKAFSSDYRKFTAAMRGECLFISVEQDFHGAAVEGVYAYGIGFSAPDTLKLTVMRSRSNVPLIDSALAHNLVQQVFKGAWSGKKYLVDLSGWFSSATGIRVRVVAAAFEREHIRVVFRPEKYSVLAR